MNVKEKLLSLGHQMPSFPVEGIPRRLQRSELVLVKKFIESVNSERIVEFEKNLSTCGWILDKWEDLVIPLYVVLPDRLLKRMKETKNAPSAFLDIDGKPALFLGYGLIGVNWSQGDVFVHPMGENRFAGEYFHPHIGSSDHKVCTGSAAPLFNLAVKAGSLDVIVLQLLMMLPEYNVDSPFSALENWVIPVTFSCCYCGRSETSRSALMACRNCGAYFCPPRVDDEEYYCSFKCGGCDYWYCGCCESNEESGYCCECYPSNDSCESCGHESPNDNSDNRSCEVCGTDGCTECLHYSDRRGEWLCDEDSDVCSICDAVLRTRDITECFNCGSDICGPCRGYYARESDDREVCLCVSCQEKLFLFTCNDCGVNFYRDEDSPRFSSSDTVCDGCVKAAEEEKEILQTRERS